jgi:hypothetical protein
MGLSGRSALAAILVAASVVSCRAGVIVAQNNWNLPGPGGWSADLQSWVITPLGNPGSGGITNSGFLRIDMPASGDPGHVDAEATASAATLFAGTWETNMWIEFDFWAQYTEPVYVQVAWGSTNDTVWADTVFDSTTDTMSTQSWTRLTSASFMSYADWGGWYDQQTFLDDLSAIDWIGVFIRRGGIGDQLYGLDDLNLMVPEPSEIAVLAVALLAACGAVWRSRRRGNAGDRPRLQ